MPWLFQGSTNDSAVPSLLCSGFQCRTRGCGAPWGTAVHCSQARNSAGSHSHRDPGENPGKIFLLKYNSLFNSTTAASYVIPYSKEVIKQAAKASVLRLPTGGWNAEFCVSLPHHHLSLPPIAFLQASSYQEIAVAISHSVKTPSFFIEVENLNQA